MGGKRTLRTVDKRSSSMGLVLYALLIFFGIRGMPFKHAGVLCVVTAATLTFLGVGAIDDMPGCRGLRCQGALPMIAGTFLFTLAIAGACFGAGAAARRLMRKAES